MMNANENHLDQSYLRKVDSNADTSIGQTIYAADLFCGCGGLTLGVREACYALGHRLEVILAIDQYEPSLDVYKANFQPQHAYKNDIWEFINGKSGDATTPEEKALLEQLGRIDILLAGPPCQGHSDLNNRTRRKDKRNELYERVGRFAELTQPRFILIENVPNVVHADEKIIEKTTLVLEKCNYNIDTGIVDLTEFGVPQKRMRHVLIASLDKDIRIEDVRLRHRISAARTVKWAIEDLEQTSLNGILNKATRHSPENMKRINYLFENNLYDLPNALRPVCHRNGHSYKSMYGRMRYDEPAQTITSGYGCPGQGRFIHPTQARALTPHEAARLQFFPDFFDFTAAKNRTSLAFMIGNAVPMNLSYSFCLEFLAGVNEASQQMIKGARSA
jgi:DNA (cytosine-5)-methyltransferase 1